MSRGRKKTSSFKATELDLETGDRTGRVEHYKARGVSEAAKMLLFTRRLKDRRCKIGPTGRVVHCPGGKAWVVTERS